MTERPRFLSRLGPADAMTVANAAVGFAACLVVFLDRTTAARLLLLAGIADGVDGVVARKFGGTAVGPHLDSLADVASFGVAPALLVATGVEATLLGGGLETRLDAVGGVDPFFLNVAAVVVGMVFVACAVVRLGVYTVEDEGRVTTHGVQTTLASTVIAAATLAVDVPRLALAVGGAVLAVGMVTPVVYPDLHAQDAGVMGVVQAAAVLSVGRVGEVFAFALLFLALGYTLLGPRFYWREMPDDGLKPGVTDTEADEDAVGSSR